MPGGTTRSGLAAILTAISGQLVNLKVVGDTSRVLWVVRQPDMVPHMGAEQDILLYPRGFSVDKPQVASAGRYEVRITRSITTVCRTRLHLDEPNRDQVWLVDPVLGHLAFEEATASALELFWPTDVNTSAILCEPMRLLRGDSMFKQSKDGAWGMSALDWEVIYDLSVDQSIQ